MKRLKMQFPVDNALERYEVLAKLALIAKKMETRGIAVDVPRAEWHIEQCNENIGIFANRFYTYSGLKMHVGKSLTLGTSMAGQTDIVKKFFWETLKAPPVIFHKISKEPQLNTAALLSYATDFKGDEHAQLRTCAASLYALRKALTARKFADNYRILGGRGNGVINFGFNVVGTKGERWSSSAQFTWREADELQRVSVNLQNVPSKEPVFDFGRGPEQLCRSLRDIVVARPGLVFGSADYDQVEARLIAFVTGDELLLDWIDTNKDLHFELARLLWPEMQIPAGLNKNTDDPAEKVLVKKFAKWREAAKPLRYALTYSVTKEDGELYVEAIFKQLKSLFPTITQDVVLDIAKRFYKIHPAALEYHARVRESVTETNKVVLSQNGAFLYLPNTMRGYNMGSNFTMQSATGFLINRALIEIDTNTDWNGPNVPLAQVHDEIIFECEPNAISRVKALVERAMSAPANYGKMTGSIPATALFGPNWSKVH